jgi:hypothetical protein
MLGEEVGTVPEDEPFTPPGTHFLVVSAQCVQSAHLGVFFGDNILEAPVEECD